MIARVRIAPLEQWCKAQLDHAISQGFEPQKYVGQQIEIITESMREGASRVCPARAWAVPQKCADKLRALDGKTSLSDRWICEHVLEMD